MKGLFSQCRDGEGSSFGFNLVWGKGPFYSIKLLLGGQKKLNG